MGYKLRGFQLSKKSHLIAKYRPIGSLAEFAAFVQVDVNGTLAGIIIAVIINTIVEGRTNDQVNKGIIVKIDLLQYRAKASYIDPAMLTSSMLSSF